MEATPRLTQGAALYPRGGRQQLSGGGALLEAPGGGSQHAAQVRSFAQGGPVVPSLWAGRPPALSARGSGCFVLRVAYLVHTVH